MLGAIFKYHLFLLVWGLNGIIYLYQGCFRSGGEAAWWWLNGGERFPPSRGKQTRDELQACGVTKIKKSVNKSITSFCVGN